MLFKFQWHIEKLLQESHLLGPGFDSIALHASKINIIKAKRNPELQENRGRIVGNNIVLISNFRLSEKHSYFYAPLHDTN